MEYYSAIECYKLLVHETPFKLKNGLYFVHERNQSQTSSDSVILYSWHSKKDNAVGTKNRSEVMMD